MKRNGSFINQKHAGFTESKSDKQNAVGYSPTYRHAGFTESKSDKHNAVGYSPTYRPAGFIESKSDKHNAVGYSPTYRHAGFTESKSDKHNAVGYSPTYRHAGFIENKSLINQLKEFGLNPKYWILKKLSGPGVGRTKPSAIKPVLLETAVPQRRIKQKTCRWMLIHKWEKDFCLLGATEENTRWIDLEWVI